MEKVFTKLLSEKDIDTIAQLTKQLNPNKTKEELKAMLSEMFQFNGYTCFGLINDNKIIGVSSGWTTVKLYSGKQLELDNVIVDSSLQSKGYGKIFISKIEYWAKENNYKTMELNTYVGNSKSHKFYFNQGFEIIGYHFQKKL